MVPGQLFQAQDGEVAMNETATAGTDRPVEGWSVVDWAAGDWERLSEESIAQGRET